MYFTLLVLKNIVCDTFYISLCISIVTLEPISFDFVVVIWCFYVYMCVLFTMQGFYYVLVS